ncbi:MAG: hypothetical protein ACR2O4_06490 [Hyphomicrobiaceae bacterium]
MKKHHYVATDAPKMRFGVYVGEGDARRRILVQLENGAYGTEDDAVAAAIDALLEQKATFRRSLRKVDVAAAEATVREHMARVRGGAAKGTFSTQQHPEALAAELASQGIDMDTARQHAASISGDKMIVQQDIPQPAGFKPDPVATAEGAKEAEQAALAEMIAPKSGGTKV